jgi:peptidyl-dipeptidase A
MTAPFPPAVTAAVLIGTLIGCAPKQSATADGAKAFLDRAEAELEKLNTEAERANWVRSTHITGDTELLAAQATERAIAANVRYAKQAAQYANLALDPVSARKILLLRNSLTLATPDDPAESQEVARITSSMEGTYGKGKYCPPGKDQCLGIEDLNKILSTSRKPDEMREAWIGWHKIAPPLRAPYKRFVELSNKGARELGFADTGAMWRSQYDMPPEAFAKEVDRLWEQVKPLYLSLHTYVRKRLREQYGDAVAAAGPMPAHLLGNMWAQEWSTLYPLFAPKGADPGFDLTAILKARRTTPKQMLQYGERFFTSLGLAPLPETFWSRSLMARPADREVVCHASAWNIDMKDDLRVKMCVEITAEDFSVVHHELGHNFYQRAYNKQPLLFRGGANDGFHEAIGDAVALSITPEYLVQLGLIPRAPDASKDLGLLMQRALDKIAFLPFGVVIDQWRWKVFSGEIPPEKYNAAWWDLKLKYQGVVPPVARSEEDFDPGAKYHVPANTPYSRYFLASILQFQFHRALAEAAGCKGPLHRCSIYENAEAGRRFREMLDLGVSRPWQEALEKLTGKREMDATAMLDYFAPLKKWLDEQNAGQTPGW